MRLRVVRSTRRPWRSSPTRTRKGEFARVFVALASVLDASVSTALGNTPASDDGHERRWRFLLLGKGGVLAHRLARPLAADLDDDQQSWCGARSHRDARLRKLARDSARYRVCLEAAAQRSSDHRSPLLVDGRWRLDTARLRDLADVR